MGERAGEERRASRDLLIVRGWGLAQEGGQFSFQGWENEGEGEGEGLVFWIFRAGGWNRINLIT